ncbi:MAG: SagB/ThcOx family dehydrogenase [bacterium]
MKVFCLIIFLLTIFSFLVTCRPTGFPSWLGARSGDQVGSMPGAAVVAAREISPFLQAMAKTPESKDTAKSVIELPAPGYKGSVPVEEAMKKRRTERNFLPRSLSKNQLAQILWAAQGITEEGGNKRAIPSAGALNPLVIFAVIGQDGVDHLSAGVYQYLPDYHQLRALSQGDLRKALAEASLSQSWMASAPVSIIIAAEYARTTGKYGKRGIRYTHMEVGHAAQNIFLQAVALNLGAGIVGAFDDAKVKDILDLPPNYDPLLLMPVGYVTSYR